MHVTEEAISSLFKMKENVRDQHRKVQRWQQIIVACWMSVVNLGIIWVLLNSAFDELIITSVGIIPLIVGFVIFPNIVCALPPLLWYNSNKYRSKVPDKIRAGVTGMYSDQVDEDDKTEWDKQLDTELGVLPY
jgi:hypothetical protein